MATATNDLPVLTRLDDAGLFADARLFSLINELSQCEKRRDDLLDRLSSEDGDQVTAAAKTACDAARAIYEQIAAIPTTTAGVLRQLELAARGWVAPSTVPMAISALRDIVDRPPPFKAGRLPAVRHASTVSQRARYDAFRPVSASDPVHSGVVLSSQACLPGRNSAGNCG